jgi:hypothetical protein
LVSVIEACLTSAGFNLGRRVVFDFLLAGVSGTIAEVDDREGVGGGDSAPHPTVNAVMESKASRAGRSRIEIFSGGSGGNEP